MSTYNYKPGLGLVGAYQVSGIPYVKGPIEDAPNGTSNKKIQFPAVTKVITITNVDESGELHCGFSSLGLSELTNVFIVPATSSMTYEVKVTELYYSGSCESFGLIAGLTFIDPHTINNAAISPSGSNWSGSLLASVG